MMGIRAALVAGFRSANEGWRIVAISGVLGLGLSVVGQRILLPNAPASPQANPIALLVGGLGMIVLVLVLSVLWTVWLGGALVWLKNRLDGTKNSWTGFVEGGKRLFWVLCWVPLLQGLFALGSPFVVDLLGALLARSIGGAVSSLLVAVWTLSSLVIFILLIFGACSLAERQQGAKAALKDSARFVRAHPGGTVGLLLVVIFLLNVAVVLVITPPLLVLASLLKLPIPPSQGQFPLFVEIPFQAMMAYTFFFMLAAQYAYYQGNQPPADISTEEARL